ncbi:MFS transporter [Neopusillimonas aromaticivorans]|uniref:MFS transporter n=1 Tax=Neopusillimonas aromaticivorans TaxID=2979868 RepID=UPI003D9EF387
MGQPAVCLDGDLADWLLHRLQHTGSLATVAGITRSAPEFKGLALGFYNTTQSLGVFAGASLGGVLSAAGNTSHVFLVCAVLAFVWFLTTRGFRNGN